MSVVFFYSGTLWFCVLPPAGGGSCTHVSSPGHVFLWKAAEVSVSEGFIYCVDVFIYTSSHLRGEGVKSQATRSRAFEMAVSVALCA